MNVIKEYNFYYENVIQKYKWNNKNVPLYNHGYLPLDNKNLIDYKDDLSWSNQYNLYVQLLSLINKDKINNKNILEIGCGLGHGANIIKNNFPVKSLTAIDINPNHILFARKNFKNIDFNIGNAASLQYPDKSFDIIYLVETFHNYTFEDSFYTKIKKILKPDGYLLITDIFFKKDLEIVRNKFKDNNFKIISELDITQEVQNSCNKDRENLNPKFFREIPDVAYKNYKNNITVYWNFIIKND